MHYAEPKVSLAAVSSVELKAGQIKKSMHLYPYDNMGKLISIRAHLFYLSN